VSSLECHWYVTVRQFLRMVLRCIEVHLFRFTLGLITNKTSERFKPVKYVCAPESVNDHFAF